MKLAEIDGKQLITVNPTDSVNHAFTLMVDHDIRHLPIVEGDRVVGIVSDRDLLIIANWIATWKSLTHATTAVGKKRVAELMSSPVSVLSRDDTVEHAAQLMLERRFSARSTPASGKTRQYRYGDRHLAMLLGRCNQVCVLPLARFPGG